LPEIWGCCKARGAIVFICIYEIAKRIGSATNDIYFAQDLEAQPGHPDSAQPNAAGFMTFQLDVAVGKTYTLESSSNLSAWYPVSTFVCTATNQFVQVPIDMQVSPWYYRLRAGTNSVGP